MAWLRVCGVAWVAGVLFSRSFFALPGQDLRTNELRVVLRHLGGDVETRNYPGKTFGEVFVCETV